MTDQPSQPNATSRRRRIGTVVRAVLQKTVTVSVERRFAHPRLQRVMRRTRKFLVENDAHELRVGDRVLIEETRPLSRHKRWRVVEVLSRAPVIEGEATEISDEVTTTE